MLQIKLEWDISSSSDVVERQVHYKIDDVDQTPITGLSADTAEWTIEVDDGAVVEWFTRVIDDAGNHTDSDPTSFTAADTIPPAPDTNLRATTVGET